MPKAKQASKKNNNQESLEAKLWQSADKLRKNMMLQNISTSFSA